MRKKPYSKIGIKRIPCKRCGKPSSEQWQICALDNVYMGICRKCGDELNEMTLKFFRIKKWKNIIAEYKGE